MLRKRKRERGTKSWTDQDQKLHVIPADRHCRTYCSKGMVSTAMAIRSAIEFNRSRSRLQNQHLPENYPEARKLVVKIEETSLAAKS
jgi:hypothetical protein